MHRIGGVWLVLGVVACAKPAEAPVIAETPPVATPAEPVDVIFPPIAPIRPDHACEDLRVVLQQQTAALPVVCAVDADCALASVQFDSCERPLAVKAGHDDAVGAVGGILQMTRKACGFLARPCAAVLAHAACDAGRCVAREGRAPIALPVWEAVLSDASGVLAGVAVNVELFDQVQCISAPCDPMRVGTLALTTSKAGIVRIDLGGDGSDVTGPGLRAAGADYAILSAAGHAPLRVTLRPTLKPVPVTLPLN